MSFWKFLVEIVAVLGVGLMFGYAAQKLRATPMIGYLVAGFVLGPGMLNLVPDVGNIQTLAELGVALLMFTIGLEFSWQRLRELGRLASQGGALQLLLTTLVGFGIAFAAGQPWKASLVLAMALTHTSTTVVLRILSDRAEMDSSHGRAVLGVSLVQDLAVVPSLILLSVLAGGRFSEGLQELGMAAVKAAVMVIILYLLSRWVFPRLFHAAFSGGERDFPVVLAACVCAGCTWAAHQLGLSPIMGAFTAGMMLADLRYAEQVRADIIPLRSIFAVLFFASIGMLSVLPARTELLNVLAMTGVIVVLKAILVVAVFTWLRQPFSVSVPAGLALAQIGEFSFVLAQDGLSRGLITRSVFEDLLTASLISLVLSPYLLRAAPAISAWLDRTLPFDFCGASRRRATPGDLKDHVVLVGYGPAGRRVRERLESLAIPYLILELNPATVAQLEDQISIRLGDATRPEILLHAGVAEARAVVISLPDPAVSVTVIQAVRMLAPEIAVIARCRYHIHKSKLTESGATLVVDEEDLVGERLAYHLQTSLSKL